MDFHRAGIRNPMRRDHPIWDDGDCDDEDHSTRGESPCHNGNDRFMGEVVKSADDDGYVCAGNNNSNSSINMESFVGIPSIVRVKRTTADAAVRRLDGSNTGNSSAASGANTTPEFAVFKSASMVASSALDVAEQADVDADVAGGAARSHPTLRLLFPARQAKVTATGSRRRHHHASLPTILKEGSASFDSSYSSIDTASSSTSSSSSSSSSSLVSACISSISSAGSYLPVPSTALNNSAPCHVHNTSSALLSSQTQQAHCEASNNHFIQRGDAQPNSGTFAGDCGLQLAQQQSGSSTPISPTPPPIRQPSLNNAKNEKSGGGCNNASTCWRWNVCSIPRLKQELLPSLEPNALAIPETLTAETIVSRICTFCKLHSVTCRSATTTGRLDAYTKCGKLKVRMQLWRNCIDRPRASGEDHKQHAMHGKLRTAIIILEVQRRHGCCIVMKFFRKDLYHAILTGDLELKNRPAGGPHGFHRKNMKHAGGVDNGDGDRKSAAPLYSSRFFTVPDCVRRQKMDHERERAMVGMRNRASTGKNPAAMVLGKDEALQDSDDHHRNRFTADGKQKAPGRNPAIHSGKKPIVMDSADTVRTSTSITSASNSSYHQHQQQHRRTSTTASVSAPATVSASAHHSPSVDFGASSLPQGPNDSIRRDADGTRHENGKLADAPATATKSATDSATDVSDSDISPFAPCILKCLELLESEHVDQNHLGMEFLSSCTNPGPSASQSSSPSSSSSSLPATPTDSNPDAAGAAAPSSPSPPPPSSPSPPQLHQSMPHYIAMMLLNKPLKETASNDSATYELASRFQSTVFGFLSLDRHGEGAEYFNMNGNDNGNNENDDFQRQHPQRGGRSRRKIPGHCFGSIVQTSHCQSTMHTGSISYANSSQEQQQQHHGSNRQLHHASSSLSFDDSVAHNGSGSGNDHNNFDDDDDDEHEYYNAPPSPPVSCNEMLADTQALAWGVLSNCLRIVASIMADKKGNCESCPDEEAVAAKTKKYKDAAEDAMRAASFRKTVEGGCDHQADDDDDDDAGQHAPEDTHEAMSQSAIHATKTTDARRSETDVPVETAKNATATSVSQPSSSSSSSAEAVVGATSKVSWGTCRILVDDCQQRILWGGVLHAMLQCIQNAPRRPQTASLAIQSLRWMNQLCSDAVSPIVKDETIQATLLLPAYEHGKQHHLELENQARLLLEEIGVMARATMPAREAEAAGLGTGGGSGVE